MYDSDADGRVKEEDTQVGDEVDMSDCQNDENGIQVTSAPTFLSGSGQMTYI